MQNDLKDSLDFIFEKEKLYESKLILYKRGKSLKSTRWKPIFASFSILVIAVMVFLPFVKDKPLNVNQGSTPLETQIQPIQPLEIFKYKGAYIGDHPSVGSIITYSLEGQPTNGIQLFTYNEPYGVRTFMIKTMDPSKDYETIFTTASYLFTLIRNVGFAEFEYDDHVYKITKSEVELAFNVNYYSIEDEDTLRSIISDLLTNEQSKEYIQQLIKTTPIE